MKKKKTDVMVGNEIAWQTVDVGDDLDLRYSGSWSILLGEDGGKVTARVYIDKNIEPEKADQIRTLTGRFIQELYCIKT